MMTTTDWFALIALIISFGALVVAVLAWLENRKANANTLHTTKIFFDSHISTTRDRVRQMNILLVPLSAKSEWSDEEKNALHLYQNIKLEVMEDYLNAFNQACNAYIANKLDKQVFLTEYKDDITRIYKSPEYRKLLERKTEDYSGIIKFIQDQKIVSV